MPLPLLLLAVGLAAADPLSELLQRGELSLVESTAGGGVARVTAIVDIAAPPQQVWDRIVAFDTYTAWMHGVLRATPVRVDDNTVDVDFLIKAPGPNVRYQARFTLDRGSNRITADATGKNLKGSRWVWQLEPRTDGTTRVFRESRAGGIEDNWALDMLGEHKEVILLGINLSSPVIEVRSLKRACEGG